MKEATPPEAFDALSQDQDAILIDCRTRAEWVYIGIPDLSEIGKKVVLESIADETGKPNDAFVSRIGEIAHAETPIYVICRSGGRSANACRLLAAHGFGNLHNVIEGFEGGLDPDGHRSSFEGWKFRNLPWRQS